MTPSESLGNNARYLDALADTTPPCLLGTPFGVVCDALRVVAASVWNVDPSVYRAGIAWAWYLGARPAALAVDGFRALLCAALVSECAPLVRESQTVGELVALLSLWMDYRPVFADMEALFATYGVRVDVRAISDPEGQVLMPVDDTRLAFYIFVLSMDWTRPMLLGEIAETARRASPLGARPFVLFYVEGSVSVPVAPAPTDGFLWVDVWESAVQPIPPTPVLPTVTRQWLYATSSVTTIDLYAGESSGNIYEQVGTSFVAKQVNPSVLQCVFGWRGTSASDYGFCTFETMTTGTGGYVRAKNITSSRIAGIFYFRYAECSDPTATVVTVYNSSNVAYNAFKYTASGTDYYYVLDGTQSDWTDDLASIGYHVVLPHDDATGTISSIALPTAHSGSYTGVSFDSLRYYAKATISNKDNSYRYCYGNATTWFSATLTWHDDTLGDLSDKIATADPSRTERKTQDVLYIVFITNGITGYVPTQNYQISDYTYNNGTHSLTFYAYGTGEWYNQPDAGRIQIRYLDGITAFNNLSAFDLVNVLSGILSKDSSTDRYAMYNAWNGDITIHAEYTE